MKRSANNGKGTGIDRLSFPLTFVFNFCLIFFAASPQISGLLFRYVYRSEGLWICNPIWTFLCAWQFSLGTGRICFLLCFVLVLIQMFVYAYLIAALACKDGRRRFYPIEILFALSVFCVLPFRPDSIPYQCRFLFWSTM